VLRVRQVNNGHRRRVFDALQNRVRQPEELMNKFQARKLWRPKLKEVAKQCSSCPFRIGNDKEFGAIVSKLKGKKASRSLIAHTRLEVRMELEHTGDFACHYTVYYDDMTMRPLTERRQCLGASAIFRGQAI
jgi:hypothetical protein